MRHNNHLRWYERASSRRRVAHSVTGGKIEVPGSKRVIYAFNGFFMSMRQKFVQPGT